jgi:tetratricopeptide (TPR) repeat protein
MAQEHFSVETYQRFLEQKATREETLLVVRHLLSECPVCQDLAGSLALAGGTWSPRPGAAQADYGRVIRSVQRASEEQAHRMAVARLRGWGQWASLDALAPADRLELVIAGSQYHHWGFYRSLLDASRWYSLRDPREAVDIMLLAMTVSELLDPAAVGGEQSAFDLRAKGRAILANARRLAADLDGARADLDAAWRLHAQGTGDPLERAQIISFDASWSRTVGQLEVAEATLDEALRIYRAAGDRHMQGRTLLQMGNAIGYADPLRALGHIKLGLRLIDARREPRLELCGKHDMAYFLANAGRPQEAVAAFEAARPLFKQFPDDWAQLRQQWLQGTIARALGHLAEATSIFRQVWEEFRARDLRFELVMVSIDLAEALAATGQCDTAAQLIAEVHPILASWRLPRHSLAAWLTFQQIVETQRQLDVFATARLFYRRHWIQPADFTA